MPDSSLLAAVLLALALGPSPAGAEGSAEDPVSLARRALEEDRLAEAREWLKAPAERGEPDALYWLGCVELEAADSKAALAVFERLVEERPDDARGHFGYGRACKLKVDESAKLFQIKWAKRMRASFERAHELDPGFPDVHFALVRFHREAPSLVGGDRRTAWVHAGELARLDPGLGEPILGDMHREDGRHAEAASAYRRALEVLPEEPGLHYLLAITLADAGRAVEAFAALDACLERFENDPIASYLVGRTAAVSGTGLARGKAALERYLASAPLAGSPEPAAAHWRLGNIAEHSGDAAAARGSYRAALKLNPGFTEAKTSLKALR